MIKGLLLLVDDEGIVIDAVYDGIGLADTLASHSCWTGVLDKENRTKGDDFFSELKEKGRAFNWDLNILIGDSAVSYRFSGGGRKGSRIIAAAETSAELTSLLEAHAVRGAGRTGELIADLKDTMERQHQDETGSTLYDEISRLNNELINIRRELTKSNVELERVNKLKNQFLGLAAHDLRNPLVNIGLLSRSLLDKTVVSEEDQTQYLNHIRDTSDFLLNLVSDLLDVSMIENGEIQLNWRKTDLIGLIEDTLAINRMIGDNKRIKLEFIKKVETAEVYIDDNKIVQVLNNLLSNAIKFSHPGSYVYVNLGETEEEFICSVRDEGQGIKREELDGLFKPFKRTSTAPTDGEKSTGLGLYIVKRLIDAHNGEIGVESSEDGGAEFRFSIPKVPAILQRTQT